MNASNDQRLGRAEAVRLGHVVRQLRLERGLHQAELGAQIGKSQSFVTMLERGDRYPTATVIGALAKVFGVSEAFLLGEEGASQTLMARRQLDWAWSAVVADPRWTLASRDRDLPLTENVRLFLIRVYERDTGRVLLLPDEEFSLNPRRQVVLVPDLRDLCEVMIDLALRMEDFGQARQLMLCALRIHLRKLAVKFGLYELAIPDEILLLDALRKREAIDPQEFARLRKWLKSGEIAYFPQNYDATEMAEGIRDFMNRAPV